jgi:hypothetical protein
VASKRRPGSNALAMDTGRLRLIAKAFYEVASTFLFSPIRKRETKFFPEDKK